MNSWYLLETTPSGEQPAGPFDHAQMAEMAMSGRLTAASRVARAGASGWTPASGDPELANLFNNEMRGIRGSLGGGSAGSAGSALESHGASSGHSAGAAPPHHPVVTALGSSHVPPYSIASAFELGWRAMVSNWGNLVLCTLIFIGGALVLNAPGWIAQIFAATMRQDGGGNGLDQAALGLGILGLSCCGWVLQVFVGLPFFAGFYYCGVRAVRGQLQPMDAFAGFKRYWAVIAVSLLTALLTLAVSVVCFIPFFIGLGISIGMEDPIAAIVAGGVSLLVLVGVMLFFIVLLTMPALLVVDPKMRAQCVPGAFSIAWQMGRGGNAPSFFLLLICGGLLMGLCLLLLVLPAILFGAPLLMCLVGAAYEMMAAPIMANPNDDRRLRG